jgi:hypothetical protein
MVFRTDEIVNIISKLSDESGLKVTVNESVKGGVIAGTACTIGGVLLGPPGLAIGGAIGGCLAYILGNGKFKPVSDVITHDMRPEDRQQLVRSVERIVADLDAADAMHLLVLIQGNAVLKGQVISEVTNFFQHQLNMAIL